MTDPALLVALPLLASALPPVIAAISTRDGWTVALLALLGQLALAVSVATDAVAGDPVATTAGGIPRQFGITLVVDPLSAPFVVLVPVAALGALAHVRDAGPRSGPFNGLVLLFVAGATGVCLTADAFNLFVFLEVASLSAYGLVAAGDSPLAAVAALRYLLVGTVGTSLYLLGVAYAYVATGALGMAALGRALGDGPLALAAFGLVAVGLGVKVALYPLHTWKPAAYEAAPTAASALLAALASTVAAYALARLLLVSFGVSLLSAVPATRSALLAAAGLSILAGSLLAFRADSLRRLLAYSSVSQFGVAVAGVAVATPVGVTGAVVHLLGHGVTKGGLFLAAGHLARSRGVETVDDYAGLAEGSPWTAGAVAVMVLGLVGVPPTVGFAGKFYVALGAVAAGSWAVAALVVLSTLLSLAYFAPLLQRMYAEHPPSGGDAPASADQSAGDGPAATDAPVEPGEGGAVWPALLAAVLTVVLGFAAPAVERLLAPTLEGLL